MNITKCYNGALAGLRPFCYDGRTRKIQVDICSQLATMRRRGAGIVDGGVVTDGDMMRLKERGEVRLK